MDPSVGWGAASTSVKCSLARSQCLSSSRATSSTRLAACIGRSPFPAPVKLLEFQYTHTHPLFADAWQCDDAFADTSVHQYGARHSTLLATMALQQHLRNDAPSQHTSFPERGNHRVRQVLIPHGPVIWGIMKRIVGVSNERQWSQEHPVQSSCIQMRLQEDSETVSTLNCRKI